MREIDADWRTSLNISADEALSTNYCCSQSCSLISLRSNRALPQPANPLDSNLIGIRTQRPVSCITNSLADSYNTHKHHSRELPVHEANTNIPTDKGESHQFLDAPYLAASDIGYRNVNVNTINKARPTAIAAKDPIPTSTELPNIAAPGGLGN